MGVCSRHNKRCSAGWGVKNRQAATQTAHATNDQSLSCSSCPSIYHHHLSFPKLIERSQAGREGRWGRHSRVWGRRGWGQKGVLLPKCKRGTAGMAHTHAPRLFFPFPLSFSHELLLQSERTEGNIYKEVCVRGGRKGTWDMQQGRSV